MWQSQQGTDAIRQCVAAALRQQFAGPRGIATRAGALVEAPTGACGLHECIRSIDKGEEAHTSRRNESVCDLDQWHGALDSGG